MRSVIKLLALTFTISLCLAFSAVAVAAQGWGFGPVVVYDMRDGRGNSQGFDTGIYLNNRGQLGSLGNDRAESVHVPNGYRVRFCEREGRNNSGEGRCEEFGEGYHNLSYPNIASFIEVSSTFGGGTGGGWGGGTNLGRPGAMVYDDRNFRGVAQSFGPGRYLFGAGQFGSLRNDEASSVIVLTGYKIRLCESEGNDGRGGGKCDEYNAGSFNLRLNDEASYIEVQRVGGWGGGTGGGWGGGTGGGWGGGTGGNQVVVFSERRQTGNQQVFGVGTYRNDYGQLGNIGNDNASSVFVPRGYRVRFCGSEGNDGRGSGRCEEYGEGRFDLRYNDDASFIEVQRVGSGGGGGWGGNTGGNEVVVFSERNQSGDQQVFGVGTFRNDYGQLGNIRNDDASSIYVPRGYRVRICAGEGGGLGSGNCEEYGPGARDLRYNNQMSFIRVWRTNY